MLTGRKLQKVVRGPRGKRRKYQEKKRWCEKTLESWVTVREASPYSLRAFQLDVAVAGQGHRLKYSAPTANSIRIP